MSLSDQVGTSLPHLPSCAEELQKLFLSCRGKEIAEMLIDRVGGCNDDVRMMIWTSKEAFMTVSHYLGGFDKLQGLTPPSDSEILFVEYYKWIQVSGCTLLK